ncbi:MAG: LytTR family DNA-binding domain-containing protein [Crocinitomicaceae bacterium]
MKVIVIEDQPQLRKNLIQQIIQADLGYYVVGEADSVSSGIQIIQKEKPDIVFMDIEIYEGTSFDILDSLRNPDFKIVFVTAHGHFAIKAIKYSAFDFLLKPFKKEELVETLQKIKSTKEEKTDYKLKFELLFNELKGKKNKKIAISSLDSVKFISIDEIIRIEADRSYCKICLTNQKQILSSKNMHHYETMLTEANFVKIHRSHIINLNFVDTVLKSNGGFVKLVNGEEIPISRRKKDYFLQVIEQNLSS